MQFSEKQGLQALWASKTLWKLSPVHLPLCHAKTVHCLIRLHLPEKKCGRKEASEIFRLTITKCCRTSFQSHCFGQTMPSTRATFSAKTGFKDGLWPAAPVTIHSSFPGDQWNLANYVENPGMPYKLQWPSCRLQRVAPIQPVFLRFFKMNEAAASGTTYGLESDALRSLRTWENPWNSRRNIIKNHPRWTSWTFWGGKTPCATKHLFHLKQPRRCFTCSASTTQACDHLRLIAKVQANLDRVQIMQLSNHSVSAIYRQQSVT